ncbi:MAG: AAA family ATPase, partial [Anaerolineae bacterium]
ESCRSALVEGLGVEPSAETVALARRIRAGEPGPETVRAELPAFLEVDLPRTERPVFVGREREMSRLDGFLARALGSEGRTIFVTGGPGRGKTALLSEFARQAMENQPDLLVANGSCSALTGVGDAYLPFREIMAMLTGDLEARWYAGSISREHAQRLWGALHGTTRALLEHGPDVISTLVRGPELLARATAAAGPQDGAWLQRLADLVQRQRSRLEGMEQSFLFEQFTNTLRRLAKDHPLLLIVDDLHWADMTSVGLLFHLGSRLAGSRILVACAYRPEEVTGVDLPSAATGRHPLQATLAEFKRRYGDVWVDLAAIGEKEARAFVDALVDSEPNRLQKRFRDGMFRRTGGHPLFVIELLRAMQARGDLVQDSEGRWIEGPDLRWDLLPERVEGVIEARIGRLSLELRDLLASASVEGEQFAAQVLARVQHLDERAVLRLLSYELGRKHRLVQASGETQAGQHHLSTYRFSHVLFRDYLYGTLGPGERSLLHRRVGRALEALQEGRLEEIAARLAHHFAGDPEKERHYAHLAGERAAAQYANDEALLHLSRALALTPADDLEGRFALLLAREQVYDRLSDRDAQRRDLAALEEIATAVADPQKQAEVALRQASCAYFCADGAQCMALAQVAAGLGQSLGNPELEARAHRLWAMALGYLGQHEAAIRHRERSLALARAAGALWLEAETLRQLSWHYSFLGERDQAEACLGAAVPIFQEVGDRRDEISVRHNLAAFSSNRFEYERAHEHWHEALRLSRELGARLLEATMRLALTELFEVCGQYATAREGDRSVLPLTREIGARSLEIRALLGVGCMTHALGESEEALPYVKEGLALAREIGERYVEAYALTHLGHVLGTLGNQDQARRAYEQALDLRREMHQEAEATEARAGLARLFLAGGDLARAMGYVGDVLHYLENGTLEGTEQPLLVYLTCYRVLQAAADARAAEILKEGYQLLQEIAGKLTDLELRRSFLENVAAHRELAQEYESLRER